MSVRHERRGLRAAAITTLIALATVGYAASPAGRGAAVSGAAGLAPRSAAVVGHSPSGRFWLKGSGDLH
jgi:hypothetical protein